MFCANCSHPDINDCVDLQQRTDGEDDYIGGGELSDPLCVVDASAPSGEVRE